MQRLWSHGHSGICPKQGSVKFGLKTTRATLHPKAHISQGLLLLHKSNVPLSPSKKTLMGRSYNWYMPLLGLSWRWTSHPIPYTQISCHPLASHYQDILHSTSLIRHDTGFHVFLYLERLVVTSKRDTLFSCQNIPNQDGQWVNILFWALQLCSFWVRGLAGRATLSQLQRALQMSLLCSVALKRRKDGPLTTDSCQWDGMLTLTRPMSSHGGDKCLANQLAYKITALPHAAHASTRSDSTYSLQLSCSQSLCVCLTNSPQCY